MIPPHSWSPYFGIALHRLVQLIQPARLDLGVVVQEDNVFATCRLEPAIARSDEPGIFRIADQTNSRAEGKGREHRLVARAIVDNNDFDRDLRSVFDNRFDTVVGQLEFVEHRNDDRYKRLAPAVDDDRWITLLNRVYQHAHMRRKFCRVEQLGHIRRCLFHNIKVTGQGRVEKGDHRVDDRGQVCRLLRAVRLGHDIAEDESNARIEPGLLTRKHERERPHLDLGTDRPQMQHMPCVGQEGLAECDREPMPSVADAGLFKVSSVFVRQHRHQCGVAVQ